MMEEEISEATLVRKVLRSLPKRSHMKVIAIEEVHDDLFVPPLTFEITLVDRVERNGKGVAFRSIHKDESIEKGKAPHGQVNESIALLTKQFSNVIKKMSSSNTYGLNNRFQNNYRSIEFDRSNSREFDRSNTRESDQSSNRDNRSFKCRECGGHGHYQVECPTYLRRLKKSFGVTLSDEESNGITKDEVFVNAFISIASTSERDSNYQSDVDLNCQSEENLSYNKMRSQWEEDTTATTIQKEKNQGLMEENQRLLTVISSLKLKLKEV